MKQKRVRKKSGTYKEPKFVIVTSNKVVPFLNLTPRLNKVPNCINTAAAVSPLCHS